MTNKPKDNDDTKPAPEQTTPGQQQDDNIDDLGRNISNPDAKPLDQPTNGEAKKPGS